MSKPEYLKNPNAWAVFFDNLTQKLVVTKTEDDGVLQRKVRAHGNFSEYVPLGLLFILALELMNSQTWLIWLLGSSLTLARISHGWGVIATYGPSLRRALGFFLTWFVYLIGASACVYYSLSCLL
ncbi:MAG: MAPEG family protein [Cyanobacteria bacterium P01_A01_bin.84]